MKQRPTRSTKNTKQLKINQFLNKDPKQTFKKQHRKPQAKKNQVTQKQCFRGFKLCLQCKTQVHIHRRVCDCGFHFKFKSQTDKAIKNKNIAVMKRQTVQISKLKNLQEKHLNMIQSLKKKLIYKQEYQKPMVDYFQVIKKGKEETVCQTGQLKIFQNHKNQFEKIFKYPVNSQLVIQYKKINRIIVILSINQQIDDQHKEQSLDDLTQKYYNLYNLNRIGVKEHCKQNIEICEFSISKSMGIGFIRSGSFRIAGSEATEIQRNKSQIVQLCELSSGQQQGSDSKNRIQYFVYIAIDSINQSILISCYNMIQQSFAENYLITGDQMGSVYFYKVDLENKKDEILRIFHSMFISQVIQLNVYPNNEVNETLVFGISFDGYLKVFNPFKTYDKMMYYECSVIRKKLKNIAIDRTGHFIALLGEGQFHFSLISFYALQKNKVENRLYLSQKIEHRILDKSNLQLTQLSFIKTINNIHEKDNDMFEMNGDFVVGGENGKVFMIKSEKLRKIAVKREKKQSEFLVSIQELEGKVVDSDLINIGDTNLVISSSQKGQFMISIIDK